MEQKKKSGLAIASLVIGIVSLLLACCYGGFIGLISLIFGIIALSTGQSKGQAIAGIVLSVLAIMISSITLLFGISLLNEVSDNNISTSANATTEAKRDSSLTTIDKTALCDKDGVKITAESLEKDCIKVKIENNSDKTIVVESNAAINNCMMYSVSMHVDGIAPGNTANAKIPLDDLQKYGIDIVGEISVNFKIYEDGGVISTLWFETDIAEIITNKNGEKTIFTPSGNQIYSDDGITINYINVEDDIFGKTVTLYVHNNTDDNITVSCDNLAVNSITLNIYKEKDILSNCGSIIEILISNTDIEENQIEEIESVEVGISTRNQIDYTTILDTQQIKFNTK